MKQLGNLVYNDKVVIFTNTKISCEDLCSNLNDEGYKASAIHGNKS